MRTEPVTAVQPMQASSGEQTVSIPADLAEASTNEFE
jgi:hypothetical protein